LKILPDVPVIVIVEVEMFATLFIRFNIPEVPLLITVFAELKVIDPDVIVFDI